MPNAILLCGGAGLRLRSVTGNVPKAMTSVAGRPFLELLLRQLRRHGFKRVILAVGYQQEVIRLHFGEHAFGLNLVYSAETSPLGTGGAVRKAADLLESKTTLVMNGDSYTDADLRGLSGNHHATKADISLIVVPVEDREDCGYVRLGQNSRVTQFKEKHSPSRSQYANAGIYMMPSCLLHDIRAGLQVSLEEEVLPQWLAEGKDIMAFIYLGRCVDIGTPERYRIAQSILANVEPDEEMTQRGVCH